MKIVKNLLLILAIISLIGCGAVVSKNSAIIAAEKQGYKNVQIISKHIFFVTWRGCGKDDDVAFKASAINVNGQRVDIILCAGWLLKGFTVRTN